MLIGCMIIEVKIHLMIFFIFLSMCYRTRVSTDRFSRVILFHHFNPKTDTNTHFDSVFSNIGWFNKKKKKTVNTVRFSIIKKVPVAFRTFSSRVIRRRNYSKCEFLTRKFFILNISGVDKINIFFN